MFSGYFNSSAGIRANLPRDDTCTVLAEFGNEYSDNGYERFVEHHKRIARKELEQYPVWRGAYGSSSLSASTRPTKKDDPFYEPTPPRPKVRDMKVKAAAENYIKAQATRELFESQRDRDAHNRDLEHLDPRGIEVLPDGTRIRKRPLGAAAKLKREQSIQFDKNFKRAAGSHQQQMPNLGRGALSHDDAQLLAEYLAPPSRHRNASLAGFYNSGSGGLLSNSDGSNRRDSTAAHLHSKESREKFVAKTEDETGCPIDASIGTVGLFRQIRRWKQHVPSYNNFSSSSFDWPLRLDLPLQDDERSFENLMKTQMTEQIKAMSDEEDRIRFLNSARSTPTYFEGDGGGAKCCQWGNGDNDNVALPSLKDVDETTNGPRVRRNAQTEAIKKKFFYNDDDDGDEEENHDHRQYSGSRVSPSPKRVHIMEGVASPLTVFNSGPKPMTARPPSSSSRNFNNNNNNSNNHQRPASARTATVTAAGMTTKTNFSRRNSEFSPLPPNQLLTSSTHHSNNRRNSVATTSTSYTNQHQKLDLASNSIHNQKSPRKPPPSFKTLNVDPRFVNNAVQTVGQRMLFANAEELKSFVRN